MKRPVKSLHGPIHGDHCGRAPFDVKGIPPVSTAIRIDHPEVALAGTADCGLAALSVAARV